MLKKIITGIMAVIMVLTLVACAPKETDTPTSIGKPETINTNTPTEIVTEPSATELTENLNTDKIDGTWIYNFDVTDIMNKSVCAALPDFAPTTVVAVPIVLELHEDGVFNMNIDTEGYSNTLHAYLDEFFEYMVEYMYQQFEGQGMTREEADAAMESTYNKTMQEYVDSIVGSLDVDSILDTAFSGIEDISIKGTWKAENGKLHLFGELEDDKLIMDYILEDGVLSINDVDDVFELAAFTETEDTWLHFEAKR